MRKKEGGKREKKTKKRIETHQDDDLKGRLVRHMAALFAFLCE